MDSPRSLWYYKGMKNNTKSSITLPPKELALVNELQRALKAKSKVEVIRKGLQKLKETLDRENLRAQYASAAKALRDSTEKEVSELDHLSSEGLPKK